MHFCILQLKPLSTVPIADQPDTEKGKLISLSSSRWEHKGVRTVAVDVMSLEDLK